MRLDKILVLIVVFLVTYVVTPNSQGQMGTVERMPIQPADLLARLEKMRFLSSSVWTALGEASGTPHIDDAWGEWSRAESFQSAAWGAATNHQWQSADRLLTEAVNSYQKALEYAAGEKPLPQQDWVELHG